MGWFNRAVRVTFIDEATGEPFGTTELPAVDLPESFEAATTLHLGDADWSVVAAEPRTRPEYTRAGSLTLRLRRVEKVDPNDILFSLPSICDAIPAVGDGTLSGDEYLLAEDDWRQFELVSRTFAADADAEIAAIRRVHEHERAAHGWRKLHVRRRPELPVATPLTLADIGHAFGVGIEVQGVGYHGAGSPIVSGYSFRAADGMQCYGVESDGRVSVLGIAQDIPEAPPTRSAAALAEIASRFDLDLVHWCRCVRVGHDDPRFRQLLTGADA